MRFLDSVARVAGALGFARRQFYFEPDSVVYEDPETGLIFSSYTSHNGISFRVAVPDPLPEDKIFDTVLQIVAPIDVGWAGWAWGGHMTYNPLAVAWANGTNNVVITSRIAYGYFSPPDYEGSVYTVLEKGTHINETHWQVTAKCTGCTRWGDDDFGYTTLEPEGQIKFAYAYSNTPVDDPADPSSSFGIHHSLGHPFYDLAQGANADFAAKVEQASGKPEEAPKETPKEEEEKEEGDEEDACE